METNGWCTECGKDVSKGTRVNVTWVQRAEILITTEFLCPSCLANVVNEPTFQSYRFVL